MYVLIKKKKYSNPKLSAARSTYQSIRGDTPSCMYSCLLGVIPLVNPAPH